MKQKFNIITSTCVPLPLENVDTDQIIPGMRRFFANLAFLCLTQVKHGDAKPIQKKSLLENFDVDD